MPKPTNPTRGQASTMSGWSARRAAFRSIAKADVIRVRPKSPTKKIQQTKADAYRELFERLDKNFPKIGPTIYKRLK